MASWWEITVPVTGAVAAGWLGAWWQGRSSLRLLREQLQDAERVRREEADAARAARAEVLRDEKLMRLYDEKRRAYAAFAALTDQAIRLRPPDKGASRDEYAAKIHELSSSLGDTWGLLTLISPTSVHMLALDFAVEFDGGNDPDELLILSSNFVDAARLDLGVDVVPVSPGTSAEHVAEVGQ